MISLIACIDTNYGIGKDNKLLYSFKEDMKFFKDTTMGHDIVMGYNTYKSIGRALEGRNNIVLSSSDLEEPFICMTKGEVIDKYKNSDKEVFIIGGAKTYMDFINYADVLYLTHVTDEKEADSYFPKFTIEDYESIVIKKCISSNGTEFIITKYTKK